VDGMRSSAQRENRTEPETERSEIGVVFVSVSVVATDTISTQLPFEMGLLLLCF
jgi:hypothetical protein